MLNLLLVITTVVVPWTTTEEILSLVHAPSDFSQIEKVTEKRLKIKIPHTYVVPTEKQVQALIVVSAHLLSHPELNTLCRVVDDAEFKRIGVAGVYKQSEHPLAVISMT